MSREPQNQSFMGTLGQTYLEGISNPSTQPIVKSGIWPIVRLLSLICLPLEGLFHRHFGMVYFGKAYLLTSAILLGSAVVLTGYDVGLIAYTLAATGFAVWHLHHIHLQWNGKVEWIFSIYDGRPWIWNWLQDHYGLPALSEYHVKMVVEPAAAMLLGLLFLPLLKGFGLVLIGSAVALAVKSSLLYTLAMVATIAIGDRDALEYAMRKVREEGTTNPGEARGYLSLAQKQLYSETAPKTKMVSPRTADAARTNPPASQRSSSHRVPTNNAPPWPANSPRSESTSTATCPECKSRINTGDKAAPPPGTTVDCPGCKSSFPWPSQTNPGHGTRTSSPEGKTQSVLEP